MEPIIHMGSSFLKAKSALNPALNKRVDETIEKFRRNSGLAGLNVEKLRSGWCSFRVTDNIRVIFHEDRGRVDLAHVDAHDAAYRWAEHHDFRFDSGGVTISEVRTEVQIQYLRDSRQLLFADYRPEYLISLGVPPQRVEDVQSVIVDPTQIIDTFPNDDDVCDNLIDLSQGRVPSRIQTSETRSEGLQRTQLWVPAVLRDAVAGDFDRWAIHLHPDHRQLIDRTFKGPARVFGPAGSGKSVVALYRGARLAENCADSRVLLTAHTQHVVDKLGRDLDQLLREKVEVRARMEVKTLERLAVELAQKLMRARITLASDGYLSSILMDLHGDYTLEQIALILNQWQSVVDGWELESYDAYANFSGQRLVRGIGAADRESIWSSIARARKVLEFKNRITLGGLLHRLASAISIEPLKAFTNIVVDEAQLFRPVELRFIRQLVSPGPDDLFLSEDRDQGIRREEFKLNDVGIDIAGRSHGLHLNYRTTKQIFGFAQDILGGARAGDTEQSSLESVMSGTEPELISCATAEDEVRAVDFKLRELVQDGYSINEIAIIARDADILRTRATDALRAAGYRFREVNGARPIGRHVLLCTMENSIGLEFRAVILIGCEEQPLRLLSVSDAQAIEQANQQQRRKFYVACTRARERLIITGAGPLNRILPQENVLRP